MTGTLQHLDPTTLMIGDNVRDNPLLDKEFLASVREHGVLQPITAVRTDAGVEVRDGQRRTLAAREARLSTVPVYVLGGEHPSSEPAERIAHQIVTNDQRAALTDAQRANGINQMLLAGMSATKVAKKLSISRDTISAAAEVAQSPTAQAALDDGQLCLTEAAAMAEFDDDPDAVTALLAAAGTATFDHRVAQLRQDRITAQARAEAETSYAQQGFTILTERPAWRDPATVSLRHLHTADGQPATEAAVTDPAYWAVLMVETSALVDTATGEELDEADVDWNTEYHPDREPAEGTRRVNSVLETIVWAPEYYCRDPHAAGLTLADFLTDAKPIVCGGRGDDDGAEATEARAEAQRAQRRKVLALNKLGRAAQQVRRDWLREHLLQRKTPVKGAVVFVTACLQRSPGLLVDHAGQQVLAQLLGQESLHDTVSKLAATADGRAQVLLLGMVLAALEGRTAKDAWRAQASHYNPVPGPPEYLAFLVANGYPLAPIEQVLTGERTADDVYAESAPRT